MVIPLSTLVLVLGLGTLLLNFIWTGIALYAGKLLSLFIRLMNDFIAWIASFDSLVLKNIPFTLALNVSLYSIIILFVVWLYKKSYHRTVGILAAIFIFQGLYTATKYNSIHREELIVFNNWKNTLIALKSDSSIIVASNDSLSSENPVIKSYNKGNFNMPLSITPLKNTLWFNSHKILIIDSTGIYNTTARPDIIVLTQSPKVNMERLLQSTKPKQVIADATNYKTYIARWAATCKKEKIPFHAMPEKGFYKLNK